MNPRVGDSAEAVTQNCGAVAYIEPTEAYSISTSTKDVYEVFGSRTQEGWTEKYDDSGRFARSFRVLDCKTG